MDFVDSLRKSSIKLLVTRHEQTAGFMAATVGRLTGNAGVALATLGPGATNLTTTAAYAHLGASSLHNQFGAVQSDLWQCCPSRNQPSGLSGLDGSQQARLKAVHYAPVGELLASAQCPILQLRGAGAFPMLLITGQKPIMRSKQGAFQIVDIVALFSPITKLTKQLVHGGLIPAYVREAMRRAEEERPGPSHLELPEDVARETVRFVLSHHALSWHAALSATEAAAL